MSNQDSIQNFLNALYYGDVAFEGLVNGLRARSWTARLNATRALVKIGKPAVPALIDALRDDERAVWMLAATALVKIGKPGVPALLDALQHDEEAVRILVSGILVQIGTPEAVAGLKVASRSTNPSVRDTSEVALARLDRAKN
ncbi:MAG: HEAT repeat domain-containing protein [Anaerolineae bacterium]|nr:HEAT repeat domain-containing protein [Anaerolineae bacterium]